MSTNQDSVILSFGALLGVSNLASTPDWPQRAKRFVEILIAGSRPNS